MSDQKNKLIPKLRFPEFEKNGEWEEKELGKLAKRVLEKNKDGLVKTVLTNSATDGILDQRDFFDKDIASKRNIDNYYIVQQGDYVYNPRISEQAPVGPLSKNKTNIIGVMSPLYTVLRFNSKENDFYEYYFKSSHWYSSIRMVSNKGARFDRMSIAVSDFMNIPVLYPKPSEQQKIASCLSSLNELIAAHKDKLEALKDHKKGLMQNLFPREDKTVPQIRFPEFEDDEEWVEDTLGERGDFTGGGTPRKSNSEFWNGVFPWISSSDIAEDSIHQIDITRFITKDAIKESATKIIPKNSLLIVSRVGVGKVAVSKEEICTSQDFSNFTPQKDDIIFLGYYLKSNKNILLGFSQGMAIKGFTKDDISGLSLPFPSVKEQQKIASCLSAVDVLITAQAEIIGQLQQHTKGLMQGLFPNT